MRLAPWLALALAAGPLGAQAPVYESARGSGGVEQRGYTFGSGIELKQASQLSLPLAAGVPLGGRTFVDITASYAATTLTAQDGTRQEIVGLTDTQLRAAYSLSSAVTLSAGLNLPSGVSQIATDQLSVVRSAAQNFLPFPVSSYGAGFGAAGGVVVVRRVGEWNVGVAGSARYISAYRPFSDSGGSYAPGPEAKIRVGFERLLGERTSITGGLTYTTFGTDEFTGVPTFVYRSGDRFIAELALARQWADGTQASAFAWSYWRSAADSAGAAVTQAGERIVHGGIAVSRRIAARAEAGGAVEARSWSALAPSHGTMVGLRANLSYRISPALSLAASGRIETGHIWLELGDAGFRGLGLTLLLVATR